MANPPPPTDSSIYGDSNSARILGSMTPFLVLALLTYAMRMYSRLWLFRNPGIDDWVMTIAMCLSIADWAFTVVEQLHTGGKHIMFLDPKDLELSMKLSFISIFFWAWAVALIKISVCFMLHRIKTSKPWKWGYGVMIAVQVAVASATFATVLLQCKPIATNWNRQIPGSKCWNEKETSWAIYSTASVYILTDIITALLPISFIMQVRRPLREKCILAFLMGLGLLASALGIVKIVAISKIKGSSDPIWQNAEGFIFAYMEQNIGIIAANIPCLKSLLERMFAEVGVHFSSWASRTRRRYGYSETTDQRTSSGPSRILSPRNATLEDKSSHDMDQVVLVDMSRQTKDMESQRSSPYFQDENEYWDGRWHAR